MSWRVEKAIERIYKAFQRNKSKIFNEDIEALKTVNEFYNDAKNETVNDNLLFAKLVTLCLTQNLIHYGSMELAIKKLDEDLDFPFDFHVDFLTKHLNNYELEKYFNSLGLKEWKNENELLQNKEIIKEHQKQMIEKIKVSWSVTQVKNSVVNTVNQLLKDVNKYR